MCTENEFWFSQLEKLITENISRIDMLTNIVSRFVQQQSETWKGGDRGQSSRGRGEHSRGVDVRIITGGNIEAQNNIYTLTVIVTTIGGVVEIDFSRGGGEDEM